MGQIPQLETTGQMSASQEKMSLGYVRPRHREIARRLVLGHSQARIARELGLNEGRLSIVCNSALFKIEVAKLERERNQSTCDVTRQIKELAPVALEVLERTMYNTKSDKIRMDIAGSLLDRAGHGAVNKSIALTANMGNVDTSQMQDQELKQLLMNRVQRINAGEEERAQELAEADAMVIEFEACSDTEQSDETPIKDSNLAEFLSLMAKESK